MTICMIYRKVVLLPILEAGTGKHNLIIELAFQCTVEPDMSSHPCDTDKVAF